MEMNSNIRIIQLALLLVHQSLPVPEALGKATIQIDVLKSLYSRLAEILKDFPDQYYSKMIIGFGMAPDAGVAPASAAKRLEVLAWHQLCLQYYLVLPLSSLLFWKRQNMSPGVVESPETDRKRTKRSFQSKTFNVEISFATRIPMKPIALALKGIEAENSTGDALRVIDIILQQQAAKSS